MSGTALQGGQNWHSPSYLVTAFFETIVFRELLAEQILPAAQWNGVFLPSDHRILCGSAQTP
ncbi:MAG: hypothetical protein JW829_08790 [Pirellulales bacterium]|nr:hypothetical protein [Pirellulales bacterium]